MNPLLNERIARFDSPFRRLDEWLAGLEPNPLLHPINMSVGEPQDAPPAWLAEAVAANAHLWNRYPPVIGTPEFRRAAQGYLERRYPAARGRIDADAQISPVTSSREGLYLAASIATSPTRIEPLALMQNPFYQTYRAAAIMAGAEPRYLRHSGFPEFALDLATVPARPPEGHCAPPRGAANGVSVGALHISRDTRTSSASEVAPEAIQRAPSRRSDVMPDAAAAARNACSGARSWINRRSVSSTTMSS